MSTAELVVRALPCAHRFRPGDDLVAPLLGALTEAGVTLADGDIVCVASKVVAIVEGALLDAPQGSEDDPRAAVRELARERAVEVVAEAPWVTVTRTHHGFVAANGGIDRSNVPGDAWLDLPRDPDASAAGVRDAVEHATGRDIAVVVTDTFGRPWRLGQTDVALGAAGLTVLRDERGTTDLDGRPLGVTIAAVGDAVAGAADLVRSKASATPFVLVRGLAPLTAAGGSAAGRGADLVRPLEEDLFRRGAAESVVEGLAARRTVRAFDVGRPVPDHLLEEAVAAATTAPAPHHTRPWRIVRLTTAARTRMLDAMADAWRGDLRGDGVVEATIDARIARSDAIHRAAPELLAVFVDLADVHAYPDERRRRAERDLFVLAGGAAIEAMLVALAARGLGAAWTSSTVFAPDTVRAALDVPDGWEPLGTIAVGWPAAPVQARPAPTVQGVLEER
jgi:coenzyme F420-0:L-glutamate ligase / coenzyme F420-1:gamma-L-glutamate ligase